ncbi:hypothetical protein Tco_0558549 [Tanacetum coccineum]
MSIQDMDDLKQQYLDEMKSLINEIQIKDYRNKKIDIEIKINELKENFNGMKICLVEKLLYDNSSPQPLEELNPKVSDAVIESFSPSPILVEDSDFLMEEIDIFLTPN